MSLPTYQAIGTAGSVVAVASPDDVLAFTLSWPAHQAGDIGLLVVYNDVGADPAPTGWTLVNSANISEAFLNVYWKRAASGAEGAVGLFSASSGIPAGSNAYGVIITYRGCVSSGNPINTSASSTRFNSTSCTFPSVTTSEADTMILLFGSRNNDSAAAAWSAQTNASLGSITERHDAGTTGGNGGGISITEGTKATAGSTGTTTSTVTSSLGGMITVALRGIVASAASPGFFQFF